MKKTIRKAIKKAYQEKEFVIFRKLAYLYNEQVEFASDYAKVIFQLSWYLVTPKNEVTTTDLKSTMDALPVLKKILKRKKAELSYDWMIKTLTQTYNRFLLSDKEKEKSIIIS